MGQWDIQKESTKAFMSFLSSKIATSSSVLDVGTGAGASLSHFATHFPLVDFEGLEPNPNLVRIGSQLSAQRKIKNLKFSQGDFKNLSRSDRQVDGVITMNTLSHLEDCLDPIREVINKLKPKWIGIHSLFYDGKISAKIEILEHSRKRKTYYNVYSLDEVNKFCKSLGYRITSTAPFNMPFPLPERENQDLMGTYTRTAHEGNKLQYIQISGPILMNHFFIIIEQK
jgi:ubiquinone/menaquinone biosynthesis C-methylase UbiE